MSKCVICIDTATGSDSTSSGAGPGDGYNAGTKISGTANATADAAGTVITLPALTDLTEVDACIGTANPPVFYFADATAGAKNFSEILSVAGSGGATPTVTVLTAFASLAANKDWAVGGVRASLFSTSSRKLWDNNGSQGDGLGTWDVEYVDASVDSQAAVLTQRGGGSGTLRMEVRTKAGYTTRAIINQTANAANFTCVATGNITFKGLQLTNSNGTKTSAIGINTSNASSVIVDDCILGDATNKLGKGVEIGAGRCTVRNSRFTYCTISGINVTVACGIYENNTFDFNAIGIAISGTGSSLCMVIKGNLFYKQTTSDIANTITGSTHADAFTFYIHDNTFDECDGHNITIAATSTQIAGFTGMRLVNNIFSNLAATKYGLQFSDVSMTLAILQAEMVQVDGNVYYAGSGAGFTNIASLDTNTDTTNPSYTDAASLNFAVGSALAGKRTPLSTGYIGGSTTRNYGVPGAAQRQESAAGGFVPIPRFISRG
jgi:hypothetical protein